MKKVIFVATNNSGGQKPPRNSYEAFLLPFHIHSIPVKVSLPDVSGSQSAWPPGELVASVSTTPFCLRLITKVSIHTNRITTNKMRNTNNSLDFLRELVSNPSDLIRTKRLLHEVHTTYYLSENFSENPDDRKNDIVFMMVLFSDLFDDLFLQTLQNPIQQQCNN